MTKLKVYVDVIGNPNYMDWFISDRFEYIRKDSRKQTDLAIFTGGSDIDPSFYNETQHTSTYSNLKRDKNELGLFSIYKQDKVPMLGICRGSQLLTVANGGKLIQNVDGHDILEPHSITLFDGSYVDIMSTHHQMHFPYYMDEDDYRILGWSTQELAQVYNFDATNNLIIEDIPEFKESEIIYFPNTRSLGIQGHPEMEGTPDETRKKMTQLVEAMFKYLL